MGAAGGVRAGAPAGEQPDHNVPSPRDAAQCIARAQGAGRPNRARALADLRPFGAAHPAALARRRLAGPARLPAQDRLAARRPHAARLARPLPQPAHGDRVRALVQRRQVRRAAIRTHRDAHVSKRALGDAERHPDDPHLFGKRKERRSRPHVREQDGAKQLRVYGGAGLLARRARAQVRASPADRGPDDARRLRARLPASRASRRADSSPAPPPYPALPPSRRAGRARGRRGRVADHGLSVHLFKVKHSSLARIGVHLREG